MSTNEDRLAMDLLAILPLPRPVYGRQLGGLVVSRVPGGHELQWGWGFDFPGWTTAELFAVAGLFGTDDVNVDDYSEEGCETCGDGAVEGVRIRVRGATRRADELDALVGRDLAGLWSELAD